MKITISKSQWEGMGKKAGWIRKAGISEATVTLYKEIETDDEGNEIDWYLRTDPLNNTYKNAKTIPLETIVTFEWEHSDPSVGYFPQIEIMKIEDAQTGEDLTPKIKSWDKMRFKDLIYMTEESYKHNQEPTQEQMDKYNKKYNAEV